MIKKLYLPLVALLVLAFSSCSKMGELSPDYFTTNPEVLEGCWWQGTCNYYRKIPGKILQEKRNS